MESNEIIEFGSVSETLGKLSLGEKKILIPEMNRIAAHLISAAFRSFGINAQVLKTYRGLDLGKKYTSGKECYPCQVTLGDILCFAKEEREKLGDAFNAKDYIYFMPESDGPCRFGLYNKYQRIVLDSFPGLKRLKISSVTTKDGYSLAGLLEKEKVPGFKKAGFLSLVVADIMDRLTWRVRPYEKEQGMTDAFIEQAMHRMAGSFETYGAGNSFDPVLAELDGVLEEAKGIMDPKISPKPLIGIVGEIFLRMHRDSNQDLIRTLDASGVFSFDVSTEACLSIAGIIHCAREGYNGVVNVYPSTCMPRITTSAIVRPLMNERQFPYLDTPYDGSFQPNREASLRTFMYQAHQHFMRHGIKMAGNHTAP